MLNQILKNTKKGQLSWLNKKHIVNNWVLWLNISVFIFLKKIILSKKRQKTFVIIKNFLLIDSSLFNNFWAKTMKIANYFNDLLSIKIKSYRKFFLEKK